MYGGLILDPGELDVLESAAMAYLGREIPVWFSGSHLNIISRPGNFGNFNCLIVICCLFVILVPRSNASSVHVLLTFLGTVF